MSFDGLPREFGLSRFRSARAAVGTVFFLNGFVLATWVPYIPRVKAVHGLGDGALGGVLLAMAGGAVAILPAAGWLVARMGSRRITLLAAAGLALVLPLPILAPTAVVAAAALALLGAANATLDVAMNAQGVAVEATLGRPVLSSLHGLFSSGGLAGAAAAVGAMAAGVPAAGHVLAVTLASFVVLVAMGGALLPTLPTGASRAPVFAWPPRGLLGLGGLTFCALLAEGAMGDWSAVYLHDALGATRAFAGTGFAAFSLTMAAGRFGGDRLVARLGPAGLLRVSGGLAAVGLVAALAIGHPVVGVAGFALVGFGLANSVPVLFRVAGRMPGVPAGTALAAVATTGYAGFLAGPPAIGLVAESVGLPAALGLVVLACAFIGLEAGRLRSPAPPPPHPLARTR
ncbi:MAG TPA: MFS transporter [Methylomirabilota bacterium]|jgi:fucose permease|nr:MFS transporter [Methylomirabilota bacterium]